MPPFAAPRLTEHAQRIGVTEINATLDITTTTTIFQAVIIVATAGCPLLRIREIRALSPSLMRLELQPRECKSDFDRRFTA